MDIPQLNDPFSSPLYVMAKGAGPRCNMACDYCYYLEKKFLIDPDRRPGGKGRFEMSDETLERFTKLYIEAQSMPEVLFCWHGGESLLRPIAFYEKAIEYQRKYADGRLIENTIQTNGTLLTDEWCRFFRHNGWIVGISIDGPQIYHDRYRRHVDGTPSFSKVMHAINLLQKHGVEWNAMAVVNDLNVRYPLEFYYFFKDTGCRYLQFTPIVERKKPHPDGRILAEPDEMAPLTEFSVTPGLWGDFLKTIFNEWVHNDVGQIYVQLFEATLANWIGVPPGLCTMAPTCGHAGVMEFNGDVYSCDHFVFPRYRLGNIRDKTLVEMMYSPRQQAFGRAKSESLPRKCQECEFLFACHGECPKNRFAKSDDGEEGLNYLCEGYLNFFRYAAPYMDFMKRQLENSLPPADVMYSGL